MITLQ
jgi:chromosome segregation ATPase